jgi:hypothetical protein
MGYRVHFTDRDNSAAQVMRHSHCRYKSSRCAPHRHPRIRACRRVHALRASALRGHESVQRHGEVPQPLSPAVCGPVSTIFLLLSCALRALQRHDSSRTPNSSTPSGPAKLTAPSARIGVEVIALTSVAVNLAALIGGIPCFLRAAELRFNRDRRPLPRLLPRHHRCGAHARPMRATPRAASTPSRATGQSDSAWCPASCCAGRGNPGDLNRAPAGSTLTQRYGTRLPTLGRPRLRAGYQNG